MYKFIESIGLLSDRNAEVVDVLCYSPDEFARKREQISIVNESHLFLDLSAFDSKTPHQKRFILIPHRLI